MTKIFTEIKRQTGYQFVYNKEALQPTSNIDLNVRNATLKQVMDLCVRDQPIGYTLDNDIKLVVIRIKSTTQQKAVNPGQSIDSATRSMISGKIVDSNKAPLEGANVMNRNTQQRTITGKEGEFEIPARKGDILEITYVGMEMKRVPVSGSNSYFTVSLSRRLRTEETVIVVSTGYQQLPKERATGSFVAINESLLNRRVSTNILDRLDGVASGVLFNKNKSFNTPDISIRGRSTIFANTNPLIILDNFPYDGDINNINPQDVQSITVLKDAAAASIWGVRAGNGVIVITTNKGKLNQGPTVSFNANVTFGEKPDLYFREQLTSKQFIEVEEFLFNNGNYDYNIQTGYDVISPAVEIMLLHKNGSITSEEKGRKLDSLSRHDNRSDVNRYFNRHSINQQYQLNLSGGGANNKFYFSAGFDRILPNSVINNSNRITLNGNNTYYLLKNKLELTTGILFTSKNENITAADYSPNFPYEKIADEMERPLAVADNVLRLGYVDTVGGGKLLDWHYRPLDELNRHLNTTQKKLTDYRINIGLNYTVLPGLKLNINYTYQKGQEQSISNASKHSYFTRNLVNQFSQIDSSGELFRPLPNGDIVTNFTNNYYAHYGRAQLGYERIFSQIHGINIIAGYEIKDYQYRMASNTLYGYNKETESNSNASINFDQEYNYYYGSSVSKIPTGISNSRTVDRFLSYFTNAAYTYDGKYTLSVSARKDESNLFGVNSNQKGVPLWSAGLSWDISRESFYNLTALPYLKFRVTFGYNGNVDKSTSAYLTAEALSAGVLNRWNNPYLIIQNPPNPSLRWEKVKNINFGFDFELKNNRISGSAEYWIKEGVDLIGNSPIAPQTGISIFRGNAANMRSRGIDLTINTRNIYSSNFKWITTVLFNVATDKITKYKVKQGTNYDIVSSNFFNPLEGYSYYSIFSYKWAGLDSAGNPLSVLDGKPSGDYSSINNSLAADNLAYSGTTTPKIFGSIRNTFSWRGLELSCNILYKFKYFFRRNSLGNSALFAARGVNSYQQSDYDLRWQKQGDELKTYVPSLIYPGSILRDWVYRYSEVLVEKGDHIRLQDIRLGYTLSKKQLNKIPLSNLSFYVYLDNVGIIWKATDRKIDPDYVNNIPAPRTYAIGLTAGF